MSGGTQVETNALGRAGQQLSLAASGVGEADPSADLSGIADAIPGSQAAAAAESLTGTWRTRFATWQTDADGQGQGMVDSASTYVATDQAAEQRTNPGGNP